MLVRPLLENAESPMLVILSGILISERLTHPSNAPAPIVLTVLGIVTELKAVLFLNALLFIPVTLNPS